MPIAPKAVRSFALRHQIAAQIRQAILEGAVEPGKRPVERTLGSEMGATVTAVREAIVHLEAEGLITARANTTTNVAVLTAEEIAQMLVVRHALEQVAAVEVARRRANAEDVQRLTGLFAKVKGSAEKRLTDFYVQHNFAWHDAVCLSLRSLSSVRWWSGRTTIFSRTPKCTPPFSRRSRGTLSRRPLKFCERGI